MSRRILRRARILDPARAVDALGTVVVEGGLVTAVALGADGAPEARPGDAVEDLDGRWLVPGLVDLRCALREPGFEHKEELRTGLRAAAAGGFTAVCSTPDTDPVCDRAGVVRFLLERAAAVGGARLWPVGAATAGLAGEGLAAMGELAEAGCVAVSAGERPVPTARLMRRVLEYASGFGLPVLVTAVDPSLGGSVDEGPWSARLGLPGAPAAAEIIGVARDLALAELTGARLHLQRLTTAGAVALVREAKARGVAVTCDVAAHHLHLTAAAHRDFDPDTKVWPPLRSEADRDALRAALADGTVDAVVSDHQPHHYEDKLLEFQAAPAGMSAVETALSLALARVHEGTLTPARLVEALAEAPRRVLGRPAQEVAPGAVADLAVIDPGATWIPQRGALLSRASNSPLLGRVLQGRAVLTLVGGAVAWRDAETLPAEETTA